MFAARFPNFGRFLGVALAMLILILAGCGGGGSGTTGANTKPGTGISLTVGSKLDPDSRLLGQMYIALLQNAGYTVNDKTGLGQTPVLDTAIKSGQIDLYPEFTGTALNINHLQSTLDPQTAYNEVKAYYEQNYKITWLDADYLLNDSDGICTSQANATRYNLKTIADLAPIASTLVITSQADTVDEAVTPVEKGYNFTFKSIDKKPEQDGFNEVKNGNAAVMVCFTSDPGIAVNNFVLLTDPKNVFPVYNPAPIVRDSTLAKSAAIATTLNPLAAKLTIDQQVQNIKKVSIDHADPVDVAKSYLQSQGLLPAS